MIRIERAESGEVGLAFRVLDAETGEDLTMRLGAISAQAVQRGPNELLTVLLECHVMPPRPPGPGFQIIPDGKVGVRSFNDQEKRDMK